MTAGFATPVTAAENGFRVPAGPAFVSIFCFAATILPSIDFCDFLITVTVANPAKPENPTRTTAAKAMREIDRGPVKDLRFSIKKLG